MPVQKKAGSLLNAPRILYIVCLVYVQVFTKPTLINNYKVLLISNIIVLFLNVLQAILFFHFYF